MKKSVCVTCGIPWVDGVGFIRKHLYPCANEEHGWLFTKEVEASDVDKPFDNDKDMQYYLQHLTEECAEVIQSISKIKRFGLNDVYVRDRLVTDTSAHLSNKQKFEVEVIQLLMLIELLSFVFNFDFKINDETRQYITKRWATWKNYSDEVLK